MRYADLTLRDRNPVKRWLQRRRYADALAALPAVPPGTRRRVLDFGAGDGELARRLAGDPSLEVWAYEPTPELMAQARQNLADAGQVVLVDRTDALVAGGFEGIFCLEVFEHLPERETAAAIEEIHRLLAPAGCAVIGVPHELHLPALLKGLFRMARRRGAFDARPAHILGAVLGRPPAPRPVAAIAPGFAYHFDHLGFDHRVLERALRARFRLERRWFSPVAALGALLNAEVYLLLRKA